MRLIDADAMAESLEHDVELDARALDSTDLVGPEREHVQFDKDCKQNCMWYLTEQPTVPAPRWRRVEEELPDEVGSYLVYAPTYIGGSSSAKECKAGVMFARWLKGGHWSIEVGYYKRPGCVTHWMPIEPPKEDA